MAIEIKVLAAGSITSSTPVESVVPDNKAQIIKNIRVVNYSLDNASITIELSTGASTYVLISPWNFALGPRQMYIDDNELTLEEGRKIKITRVTGADPIHYVISGIERDV